MFADDTGKIILVKHLIFKEFINGKITLTPDPRLVRPCLIISEIEDKRYILPISSSISNKDYINKKIKIEREDLVFDNLKYDNNYIKLDQILKIDTYYRKQVGELDKLKYYRCLLRLKKFYEKSRYGCKEYEEIKQDVNKQIKELKLSI